MTFEVEVADQTRTISIEPLGDAGGREGAFRVFVDGMALEVTIVRTDLGLAATFQDGRVVDAALTPQGRGEWFVQLPHVAMVAAVDRRRHATGASGTVVDGVQRVSAPMPGRVIRVLVKPGDAVTLGQGLVVVEAMKMENELVSPKSGTVQDVTVAEGQSIEAGRLLVIVE